MMMNESNRIELNQIESNQIIEWFTANNTVAGVAGVPHSSFPSSYPPSTPFPRHFDELQKNFAGQHIDLPVHVHRNLES
jgi:hypothetical protein